MTVNNINNNEVSGSRLNLDQTAASSRTSGAGSAQNSSDASNTGADSIALTSSSSLVQQALNAGSDSRTARVQQLKALVQSNQYQPSAQEVSSALISAHIAGV
ncbi:MAG TPA: flagellar biosynthesis anti-sigma factor FlgM [Bryobacteraceae bacterium]|nr:flagellar biosynthesis anti-sigma factor FlgM [Bryobacteraceae bacterium]